MLPSTATNALGDNVKFFRTLTLAVFVPLTALTSAFIFTLSPSALAFTETPTLDTCPTYPETQPDYVYEQMREDSGFDSFFSLIADGRAYLIYSGYRSDATDWFYAVTTSDPSQSLELFHVSGTAPNRIYTVDTVPNQTSTAYYWRYNFTALQSNFSDLWTDTPSSQQYLQSTTANAWGALDSPSGTTRYCLIASNQSTIAINTDGSPAYLPTLTSVPPIFEDLCSNFSDIQYEVPDALEIVDGECVAPSSGSGEAMSPSDLAQLIGISLAFGAGVWFLKYFVWGRND